MSLLEGIISGLIVEAFALTGRRLMIAARKAGHSGKADFEIARWFDTYQLTESSPKVEINESSAQAVADALQNSAVHAIIHELLAVRLTDAPEMEVERLEAALCDVLTAESCGNAASSVFAALDHHICTLVGRLSTDKGSALAQLRQEAFLSRVNATLSVIERHTAVLAKRDDPGEARRFVARYRRQAREHHGKMEPPDFQRRRRVPLQNLYVPPKILTADQSSAGLVRELSVWEFDEEIDRTVLLGDPGGGKTTCAQFLIHRHACDEHSKIPFLVTLRDFAAEDPPRRSVIRFIEQRLETFYQCRPPNGLIDRLLLDGAAIVVFDGLDELVDTTRRSEVASIVELFCVEYPLTRVLVTSRMVGYDQAKLDVRNFTEYQAAEFDEDQVQDYVLRWFGQEEGTSSLRAGAIAEAFMAESANVPDLRANPLMLALMCILYRGEGAIPRNRPEVYEECSRLLFTKWDERRKIHVELRAKHLIEPALRHLAYWLLTRNTVNSTVTKRELIAETASFMGGRRFEDPDEARAAAEQFVDFCRGRGWVFSDAGTTAQGEDLYTFTHRTFMEYFAAAYLAADCDTPTSLAKRLAPHIAREEWDMLGQLAIQIKDRNANRGAERIMETLLNERRHRAEKGRGNVLGFLARCLSFTDPPPSLVRTLTSRILDHSVPDLCSMEKTEPLRWLLESADSTSTDVATEIGNRIAATIDSPNEEQRVNMFRLMFMARSMSRGQNSGKFWNDWQDEISTRYKAEVAAHIHVPDLGVAAWHRKLIEGQELFAIHGESLEFIFFSPGSVVRNIGWVSIAWSCLETIIRGPSAIEDAYVKEVLDLIGNRLQVRTDTPQIKPPVSSTLGWLQDKRFISEHYKCPPEMYGPAAFIAAVFAESSDLPKGLEPNRLGPLADFYPYLRYRGTGDGKAEFPPLPVDGHLQRLFIDWALGEVDLVGTS
ncbi:NACHT domain-containing protein [Nonomuraea sp. NPDC050022]|uniref:NACHT domain-containing protein n=1 Tax=Nonomuraea sp. NPDC050022 TaxID=3364358 RepID=UPI0037890ADA